MSWAFEGQNSGRRGDRGSCGAWERGYVGKYREDALCPVTQGAQSGWGMGGQGAWVWGMRVPWPRTSPMDHPIEHCACCFHQHVPLWLLHRARPLDLVSSPLTCLCAVSVALAETCSWACRWPTLRSGSGWCAGR